MIEVALYISIFIGMSGLMALVEAAILGVSRAEVEELVALGKTGARSLQALVHRITRAVVVLVMLTNMINVLGPILIGRKAIQYFGDRSIVPVTLVLVLGTIVFSEIIPKSLGSHYAPLVARVAAPVIETLGRLLYPVVIALEAFAGLFKTGQREIGTEEQIRSLARLGQKAGLIERGEGRLIPRVFVLNDLTARELMTPLDQVVYIGHAATVSQAADILLEHEFSRYPLLDDQLQPVGIVLGREILKATSQGRGHEPCLHVSLPCSTVPPNALADDLLVKFRSERVHMTVVMEQERAVGIVTLEDVLEQLVGPIDDEKD